MRRSPRKRRSTSASPSKANRRKRRPPRRSQKNNGGPIIAVVGVIVCMIVVFSVMNNTTKRRRPKKKRKTPQTVINEYKKTKNTETVKPKKDAPQNKEIALNTPLPKTTKPTPRTLGLYEMPPANNTPRPPIQQTRKPNSVKPPIQKPENKNGRKTLGLYGPPQQNSGMPAQRKPKQRPQQQINKLSPDQLYQQKCEQADATPSVTRFLELARWCKQNNMRGRMEDAYHKVLQLDSGNSQAREALGYIRIRSAWVKPKDAARLGYYKYQGQWCKASELKAKGLVLCNDQWFTKAQARSKGFVKRDERWVAKTSVKTNKPNITKRNTPGQAFSLAYRYIKIHAPKGAWKKNNNQNNKVQMIRNAHNNLEMVISYFETRRTYRFPGSNKKIAGSRTKALLKMMVGTLRKQFEPLKMNNIVKRSYRPGSFSQVMGTGIRKRDRLPMVIICSFFKYNPDNYCIIITIPKRNYNKKTFRQAQQLLNNIEKLRKARAKAIKKSG